MSDLTELKPGDRLRLHGQTVAIRCSVWLEQDDYVWSEHVLETDEPTLRWFSVEQDEDELLLHTWETRTDLVAEPDGRWVRVDGRRWTRYEHGTANFMVEGPSHYPPAGRCEYHDYRDDDLRLSFERFGDLPWEISVGRRVTPAEVCREEAGGSDAAQS